MGRKRNDGSEPIKKNYFDEEQEKAVILYNNENDPEIKIKIYNDHLNRSINKLAECVIRTYKLYRKGYTYEEIHNEVLCHLLEKIPLFKPNTYIGGFPLWIDDANITGSTKISNSKYLTNWDNFYRDRRKILKEYKNIYKKCNFIKTGDLKLLTNNISENKLTPSDKLFQKEAWNRIVIEKEELLRLLPNSEAKTEYEKSFQNLATYLNGGTKAYSYFQTIIKHYLLGMKKKDEEYIIKHLDYADCVNELEGKKEYSYYMDNNNDFTLSFFNEFTILLGDILKGDIKLDPPLNDKEYKVGISVLEMFENWHEIFPEFGKSKKYDKRLILLTLNNMSGCDTKEIRKALARLKDVYFDFKKETLE